MMCRGLITTPDGEIVARPFIKFHNYEQHIAPLPLEPFKVTEKMDGSLLIVTTYQRERIVATRGSFMSEQAHHGRKIIAEKYADFDFLPYYTYLFEIVYKSNRIVVDYGEQDDIILLAVIRTQTGEEIDIHDPAWGDMWPFPVVRHYDGITDIATLRAIEEENREGFVIRFESGLRLKMKMADYVRLHRLLTQINARIIWDILRNNQSFEELLERVPDEFYTWVKNTRDLLIARYETIEEESQRLYVQVKDLPTRKEQAMVVAKMPQAAVVFRMLDGKDYSDIIWKQLRPLAEKPFKEESEETA